MITPLDEQGRQYLRTRNFVLQVGVPMPFNCIRCWINGEPSYRHSVLSRDEENWSLRQLDCVEIGLLQKQ